MVFWFFWLKKGSDKHQSKTSQWHPMTKLHIIQYTIIIKKLAQWIHIELRFLFPEVSGDTIGYTGYGPDHRIVPYGFRRACVPSVISRCWTEPKYAKSWPISKWPRGFLEVLRDGYFIDFIDVVFVDSDPCLLHLTGAKRKEWGNDPLNLVIIIPFPHSHPFPTKHQ